MDWLWAVIGFICGALPFAVWIGQYGIKRDIRQYGDGNPGSFNVIRSGGLAWGGLALFLEIGKGALPVGLAAHIFNVTGLPLIAAALAPALGHAFSPFLNFKGGKAIAATFGVWIGLSIWTVSGVGLFALIFWYLFMTVSGWALMFTMATVLLYLIISGAPLTWFVIWFGHLLIFIWKHRAELNTLPRFKLPSFFYRLTSQS